MIEPRAFISADHLSGSDASSADFLKSTINDAWSKHQQKEQPTAGTNGSEASSNKNDGTASAMQAFPVLTIPDYSSMKHGALYEPLTVPNKPEENTHAIKHHSKRHPHVGIHHVASKRSTAESETHSPNGDEVTASSNHVELHKQSADTEDKTIHKVTFTPVDSKAADLIAPTSGFRETIDKLSLKARKEFEERPIEALAAAEISSPVLAAVAVGYGFAEAADLLHDGFRALSHLAHGLGKFTLHEAKAVGHAAAKISHAFTSLATETDLAIDESVSDIHDRQFADLDRHRRLEFYQTQDDDNDRAMSVPLSTLHR